MARVKVGNGPIIDTQITGTTKTNLYPPAKVAKKKKKKKKAKSLGLRETVLLLEAVGGPSPHQCSNILTLFLFSVPISWG
jgi:hypothetical protein